MNTFLEDLVKLQQDGSGAISAPTNWTKAPLLEVPTDLDDVIDELVECALIGGIGRDTGRWHFFVGSPGNGKSAAVGKLWRRLHITNNIDSLAHRRNGDVVSCSELTHDEIPYLIEVFESGNRFPSLRIAQDASVVKDPYLPNVNPAKDLLELLEDSWNKGVSLVICTNRGVIERAFREGKDRYKQKSPEWFRTLAQVADNNKAELNFVSNPQNKKSVFKNLSFKYTTLDLQSLAICNNTLREMILKATDEDKWKCCNSCAESELCPFFLNRCWLSQDGGAERLSTLVAHAELLSGQVVVFREAIALISFLLAGCPQDYLVSTPCCWVRDRALKNDLFALLSRRFYVSLFSSFNPFSLEQSVGARRNQLDHLSSIAAEVGGSHPLAQMVRGIGKTLSTDVGLSRLLGPSGEFSKMDPLLLPQNQSFYDQWDSDLEHILDQSHPSVTTLERICINIWIDVEKGLEGLPTSVEKIRSLRRWISSFTLRLGAMINGDVNLGNELGKLSEVISLSSKKENLWTEDELRKFSDLQEHLRDLVFSSENGIKLRDNVSLAGAWATTNLAPKLRRQIGLSTLGLQVEVGKQVVQVNGHLFTWLLRKRDDRLSTHSFPPELLETIIDAQSMAACKGDYAYQDDGVVLRVTMPDGRQIRLERIINGEVTAYAD